MNEGRPGGRSGEVPDAWTLAGTLLIVAAGIAVLRIGDTRRRRQSRFDHRRASAAR